MAMVFTELKDAEIAQIRSAYQQQIAALQGTLDSLSSEKERLYSDYSEKVKAATAFAEADCFACASSALCSEVRLTTSACACCMAC